MPDPDLKPLNTNRQSLAVFVFCFKIHALLLSNSIAAVLRTAFFVNGNCCQLFHNFFSIKLGIYCRRQADVNNFVCTIRIEEFQLFKVLKLTINNHQRDSGLHLLITLSHKWRIQLSATLGDELFCHDGRRVGDEQFAMLGDVDELFETSQCPAKTKPHLSVDPD